MLKLNLTLQAWNTAEFRNVFLQEICLLDADTLPLQQGLQHSSYANSDDLTASVLSIKNDDEKLFIKAGLFYTGIIAGCNCADDPTPIDENNEYCEVLFSVDRNTAQTTVTLID